MSENNLHTNITTVYENKMIVLFYNVDRKLEFAIDFNNRIGANIYVEPHCTFIDEFYV